VAKSGEPRRAIRQVVRGLPTAQFVLKTDVASYDASIDHVKLLDRLAAVVPDRDVLNLVGKMCGRVAEAGGLYFEYRRGTHLGSPLSPYSVRSSSGSWTRASKPPGSSACAIWMM
jgi:hypothetical protein